MKSLNNINYHTLIYETWKHFRRARKENVYTSEWENGERENPLLKKSTWRKGLKGNIHYIQYFCWLVQRCIHSS